MKIFNAKPEVFLDEDLMRPIKVYTATDAVTLKFIGSAMIPLPGMQPIESPFEIEAKTLTEAFEKYDEAYKAEIERIEKEIEEQQAAASIVTPSKDIVI
jgi:hypothetical protein